MQGIDSMPKCKEPLRYPGIKGVIKKEDTLYPPPYMHE
jgi:hypothetical protein